jgi:hypothetical protein
MLVCVLVYHLYWHLICKTATMIKGWRSEDPRPPDNSGAGAKHVESGGDGA